MKKLIFIFAAAIFVFACSAEEKKLELFSPEAFAFSMENGWELNASVQVKGFEQKEGKNSYAAHFAYTVDFVTPENDTLVEADFGEIEKNKEEEIADLPIDIQIEIDSSFSAGKYEMIIRVNDLLSSKTAFIKQPFELENM